jgi:hypothetical protein
MYIVTYTYMYTGTSIHKCEYTQIDRYGELRGSKRERKRKERKSEIARAREREREREKEEGLSVCVCVRACVSVWASVYVSACVRARILMCEHVL